MLEKRQRQRMAGSVCVYIYVCGVRIASVHLHPTLPACHLRSSFSRPRTDERDKAKAEAHQYKQQVTLSVSASGRCLSTFDSFRSALDGSIRID